MLWRHFFEAFGASARGFVFELRRTIELVRYPHPLHPPALPGWVPAVRKKCCGSTDTLSAAATADAVSDGSGAHEVRLSGSAAVLGEYSSTRKLSLAYRLSQL